MSNFLRSSIELGPVELLIASSVISSSVTSRQRAERKQFTVGEIARQHFVWVGVLGLRGVGRRFGGVSLVDFF